jgi:hypothetical protein
MHKPDATRRRANHLPDNSQAPDSSSAPPGRWLRRRTQFSDESQKYMFVTRPRDLPDLPQ